MFYISVMMGVQMCTFLSFCNLQFQLMMTTMTLIKKIKGNTATERKDYPLLTVTAN